MYGCNAAICGCSDAIYGSDDAVYGCGETLGELSAVQATLLRFLRAMFFYLVVQCFYLWSA
eukprot:3469002-Rhodomonas_salina.1